MNKYLKTLGVWAGITLVVLSVCTFVKLDSQAYGNGSMFHDSQTDKFLIINNLFFAFLCFVGGYFVWRLRGRKPEGKIVFLKFLLSLLMGPISFGIVFGLTIIAVKTNPNMHISDNYVVYSIFVLYVPAVICVWSEKKVSLTDKFVCWAVSSVAGVFVGHSFQSLPIVPVILSIIIVMVMLKKYSKGE